MTADDASTLDAPPASGTVASDPGAAQVEPLPASGTTGREWWRSAVIYQIYPRSFADADGNGIGDLRGITERLPALADLGVDAVWLSPFFTSPQRDAGYDVADYRDVDPIFGSLDDFDRLVTVAHDLGLKVIVDIVPNHSSSDHAWFQAALAAGRGSVERSHYLFRDGRGDAGELPPNNWQSVFGGGAWTRVTEPDGSPGQWYLHLFDASQPDFDWTDEWVREQFDAILRFWLDRGADGFRIDVAHGLVKAEGLPDWDEPATLGAAQSGEPLESAQSGVPLGSAQSGVPLEPEIQGHADPAPPHPPFWDQPGVHEIWRRWHRVAAEYPGDRAFCGEAWVEPLTDMALFVRPDELQQTFNFIYLMTPWDASALRTTIDDSLALFGGVGAPSTWVLSNHDVVRHASRLALSGGGTPIHGGIGPNSPEHPDPVLGLRRARAATALMLALPGSAYLYQGEELGLPEVMDLPDAARQDPSFFRTKGERYGRDGCRVPIPWAADAPAYGFSGTGESWLPQPDEWADLARDRQEGVPGSTLELYRRALQVRRDHGLGLGAVEWLEGYPDTVVAFRNGAITVVTNFGPGPVELPVGEVVLSSAETHEAALAPDATVWLLAG